MKNLNNHKQQSSRMVLRRIIAASCSFLVLLGGCGQTIIVEPGSGSGGEVGDEPEPIEPGSDNGKDNQTNEYGYEEGVNAGYYRAVFGLEYYNIPDRDRAADGYFDMGDKIYIDGTAKLDNELWGKTSDNRWVLISDKQYLYLPKEETLNYTETDVNENYVSKQTRFTDCYTVPVSGIIPSSSKDISKGDLVYIETKVNDGQGNVFGKMGKNKWILISADGTEFFTESSVGSDSSSNGGANTVPDVPMLVKEDRVTNSSDYYFPYSDCSYLSMSDLNGFTQTDANLARNEIYARHGRMFDTAFIRDYFDSKSWYHPYIKPSEFDESVLNKYEKANVQLIVDYERQMGWR